MIKTEIRKDTPDREGLAVIEATGTVPELLNDAAILINGIYRQLGGASQELALAFRYGLVNMAMDPESPMWGNAVNQTGFAVREEQGGF